MVRRTAFAYLHTTNNNYLYRNIANRPTSRIVYDALNNPKAQTTYAYDGSTLASTSGTPAPNHDYTNFGSAYTTRGNLTQTSRWLNTSGSWLSTNNTYDDLGNMRTSKDPGLHTTTFDYTDNWGDAAPCTIGANTFAFPTTITDALNHRVKKSYFRCTGLTQSTKDENDIVAARAGTTFAYDLMNRLSQANRPDGGQTSYCYSDVSGSSCYSGSPPLARTQTDKVTGSLNLVNTTVLDGLGRVQQTQLHDPDCGGGSGLVKVDYAYGYTPATNSRFTQVSTPYCNNPDATYGLMMTTNSDALDRVKSVVQTDGSTVSTTFGATSAGLTTTVTDEAGKQRKSQTDALGRLTAVWEDPSVGNYQTDYGYDTLDNLISVTQRGGDNNSGNWRNRSFTYDSLSRLTSDVNPESGTIAYTYDADSNVQTKVAPIPNKIPGDTSSPQTLTTTFFYDQVHRLYKKTYTDTTPTVTYGYDGIAGLSGCTPAFSPTEAVGRRTSMCDAAGLATWDYFVMGRTKKEQRTIGTLTKSTNYTYNYDGSVATINYPSGRTVTYTPNTAARALQAIDTANSFNYVKSASYKPDGSLAGMLNGQVVGGFAGITTSNSYNKRLQPITLSASAPGQTVFSVSYDFHLGAGDNGNVFQVVNDRDTTRTVNYTYDALNRITSGFTTSNRWGDNYVIDGWGNLYQKNAYPGKLVYDPLTQTVSTKNQFLGMCYDKAGNLLGQPGACPASPPYAPTYTYDAENRLTTTGGVTYTYDGDGKRVKKSNGPLYWTGMGTDALDETDLAGSVLREYIYFNGKRVARLSPPSTVRYFFSDHLGSHDVVTNSTGTIQKESDYGPYGEERVITGTLSEPYKFTGKERDAESGLDNFGKRYYSSAMGRFSSTDPGPYIWRDPQTLNRYTYTRNNPLRYVDPTGMYFVVAPEMQAQVKQYISTMLRSPGGAAMIRAISANPKPNFYGQGQLDRRQVPGTNQTAVTNGTTTPIAGNQPGQVAGTQTTLSNSNIAFTAGMSTGNIFAVGLKAFAHEDAHVVDINAAHTLQQAAAAGAAGDAPTQPGAENTAGGTAEGRALRVMGELGDEGQSFQPNAQTDAQADTIIQSGMQQFAQDQLQQINQAVQHHGCAHDRDGQHCD